MNKLTLILIVLFISCGSPNEVRNTEFSIPIDTTFVDVVDTVFVQEEPIIEQHKLTKRVSVKSSKNIKKEDPLISRTDSIVRALDNRIIEVMDSLKEFRSLKK